MERWTLGEAVVWAAVVVLLGAFGPIAAFERWYMRLPWQRKALYLLAHSLVVVVVKTFGPGFASRFARPS